MSDRPRSDQGSAAVVQVGSRVRVLPEFDIPEMFRDGPSEGVVDHVLDDGTLVVVVDGKSVPYQPNHVEAVGV